MVVNECTSSFDDELDLQRTINLANNEEDRPGADTVVLQAGCTYTFSEPVGETGPIDALPAITSNITILGKGATIQMADDAASELDHIIRVTRDGRLTLRDVTLRNGVSPPPFGGAAVYNIGTTTMEDVIVRDNVHNAVFNHWDGHLTILDSHFEDNDSQSGNGAALSTQGVLIVRGTTFESNWTFRGGEEPHNGGALFIGDEAAALITESRFHRNGATGRGGAIFSFGAVVVSKSTFTENTSWGAGAVTNWTGDLQVNTSYFGQNRSFDQGAAIYGGNSAIISNSTFWRNVADREGGAIRGGISGLLSIRNATFAENDSLMNEGDAVWQADSSTGTTRASLFSGHDSTCSDVANGGSNIVWPADPTCPDFFVGDPKLMAPAVNGSGTPTMKLGSASFALDATNPHNCTSSDQRGQPRPAGVGCDIGAYEDQLPSTPGTPVITAGGPSPSKTGALTFGWGSSTDPDGPVFYRLYYRDADDGSATAIRVGTPTSRAVNLAEGTFRLHVTANDENHEVAGSALTGVVVDKTAPNPPLLSAPTPHYTDGIGNGWYADSVLVHIQADGDPDLGDGSPGSGVGSVTPSPTYATSGTHTATGTVTDRADNVSAAASLTVNVDAEPPSVQFDACPSTVLLHTETSLTWSASDPSSGLATPASGAIVLDTSTIGTKSVTAHATDNVGHDASVTCSFDVIYDFTGFFEPVVNPPAVSSFAAGSVVPVSFSLAGDQGLDVLAPGYPQSVNASCTDFGQSLTGDPTRVTKQGLTFAYGGDGRYSYRWKTDTAWRGTCRQLIVKLDDNTYHWANVSFR